MNIAIEKRDGYAIVHVEGRVIRENQAELRQQMEELVASGVERLALNLGGVDYMDSSALGCCASVQKLLQQKGTGALVVFGASGDIQKVWKMIRLDLVIPVLPDEAAAEAHLLGKAPPPGQ